MADTVDDQQVDGGGSKPRCATPWPGEKCLVRAGPDVEGSRVKPTLQDTEQGVASQTTHDTSDGSSAATTGMRGGEKSTDQVRGDKDILYGGRGRSLESVVLHEASPQKVGGTEMKLGERPPSENVNGEVKEIHKGGESGTLHGRTANPSSPKRAGGVIQAPTQYRKSIFRKPRSPQRPRQEGIREQVTTRSTAMLTAARPACFAAPTPNAVGCTAADDEVEQNIANDVGSHPEIIGPACTPRTLCTAGSFRATSKLLLSQSPAPARDLDPANRNTTKFTDRVGQVDGKPHRCERHSLVACTLCGSTCASGSLRSSGANGTGAIGQPSAGTTPVISGTAIPISVVAMSGNASHIADRRNASRLADAVQSVQSHGVGEDQMHLARNSDILQNEKQTKSAFPQTTAGKGAATGVAPGEPCDRHLLLDCILCKMLSPTVYGGGVSPTVRGGVSQSSHGGVQHLQGTLGRSTSLPALGAASQRNINGGGSDMRGETAAEAFAMGTRDRRHTARDPSMNRCERHDLLGCFLCGLGTVNSTRSGGGVSKQKFCAKEAATLPSPQRLVLPPPVLQNSELQTGITSPSRSFVDQTWPNSSGTTLGFRLAPPEKGFAAASKCSVPSNDLLTSHSNGLNKGISGSKSTDGLIVPGFAKEVRESPKGENQAGDDGGCTAGTKAIELPVERSSDAAVDIVRRARRHRSLGGTPRRRRVSKSPNSVRRNGRSSRYSSSLSLLDNNSGRRGLSLRASNGGSASTTRDLRNTAGARGSAQANTVASATRAREKGDGRNFTARAITAALAVLK